MNFILSAVLAVLIFFTGFFYSKTPNTKIYPPLLSKKYPLSTPVSFWSSILGMRRFAADIVWIQTLQYYGSGHAELHAHGCKHCGGDHDGHEHAVHEMFPRLQQYWQQIIRLDPLFVSAYLTGPATVGWNLKRHDEAMELLDEEIKAVESVIDKFRNTDIIEIDKTHPLIIGNRPYLEEVKIKLYTLKSILVYLHNEQFEKAMPLLEKIASSKDTPAELKVVLAQIYERNKLYRKAAKLWMEIYDSCNDAKRKESAKNHLEELKKFIF